MTSRFNIKTTTATAYWIERIEKIVFKIVFTEMT